MRLVIVDEKYKHDAISDTLKAKREFIILKHQKIIFPFSKFLNLHNIYV